jgi:signal transduction histidine kinase
MKTEHKIILVSAVFGLGAWVIESVLDYLFYYEGSFYDLLVLDVPSHEIYVRTIILTSYVVFGMIISRLFRMRKKAQELLHKAYDELEIRVDERTADLKESNVLLKKEIEQRKRAEEQLHQSEAMLRAIFDGIRDPLILVGKNMEAKMLNQAAAEYYGVTDPQETVGRLCYEVLRGKSKRCEGCEAFSVPANGSTISYERKGILDPDRFERVDMYPLTGDSGNLGDVIIRVNDITERRLFERHLAQKEKLSSLGVLVSSIAHEINNPNNFVSFNIPILREYMHDMIPIIDEYAAGHTDFEVCHLPYPEFRQDIFKLLDNLENGSDRIKAFVSNLRGFAQEQRNKSQQWIDLKDVIERVFSICYSKIRNSVKSFVQKIPEHLPKIHAHPYMLEQILINLLMNAAQAADKKDSWIRLKVTVNNDETGHTVIEVSDNGCGMDEETQYKIFDPFFSTKSSAEGTGLGLFICHRLVETLKGRIELKSEPGEGSIFKVILPVKG